MAKNALRGTIPIQRTNRRGKQTPGVGGLTMMEMLRLSQNGLSGTIPPELCSLTNLQRLQVDENHLTGKSTGQGEDLG